MKAEPVSGHEAGLLRPVERPVALRQSVYKALTDLVVGGRLRPGQHLVETDLARHLGVSRQPVREALHRLQAEGWIDLRPNEGAFVHVPTEREVDDLLDVRELLETEAARQAARQAGPGQMERLEEICHQGEAAVRGGDMQRVVSANNDFHSTLAELAGNAVLGQLAEVVARRTRWYYRLVAPLRGQDSCGEHRAIANAIAAADQERAAKAARAHIARTRLIYHRSGLPS